MLDSGIAMWWICCTASCRTIVSLSVGGVVQHVLSRGPSSGVWAIYRTTIRCCTTNLTGYGHAVHLQLVVRLSVGGIVQHVRSRCPCSGVWLLWRWQANLQTKKLLTAVELQQLLSTTFRLLHGAAESCVEVHERQARDEVNEDDAEPEVDVEVDVHVFGNERYEVDATADDRRVRFNVRRQLQALDAHLHEPRQLGHQCRHVHTDDHLPQPKHSGQIGSGQRRVEDVMYTFPPLLSVMCQSSSFINLMTTPVTDVLYTSSSWSAFTTFSWHCYYYVPSRTLRSSGSNLSSPRVRTGFGSRSFSVLLPSFRIPSLGHSKQLYHILFSPPT